MGLYQEGPLPEEHGFRLPLGRPPNNVRESGCGDNGMREGEEEGVLG